MIGGYCLYKMIRRNGMSRGTGTMSRRGAVKPRNIDVIKQQNKVILELQDLVNQQGLIIKGLMKELQE